MKKPDKYGLRLETNNFKNIISGLAANVDYDERLRMIEIEDTSGDIYQFENAKKSDWDALISCINSEKKLNECIDDFKQKYESPYYYYYRLIVSSQREQLM